MSLSPEAWTAIGVVVSAIAAAMSTIGVARINATRTQAAQASKAAGEASTAAAEARDLARPTGNGFAPDVRAALAALAEAVARIERRLDAEAVGARKSAELLAEHLHDHARAGIDRH